MEDKDGVRDAANYWGLRFVNRNDYPAYMRADPYRWAHECIEELRRLIQDVQSNRNRP
jgi:hypothetical protein